MSYEDCYCPFSCVFAAVAPVVFEEEKVGFYDFVAGCAAGEYVLKFFTTTPWDAHTARFHRALSCSVFY